MNHHRSLLLPSEPDNRDDSGERRSQSLRFRVSYSQDCDGRNPYDANSAMAHSQTPQWIAE